jgi:hypothetical protein
MKRKDKSSNPTMDLIAFGRTPLAQYLNFLFSIPLLRHSFLSYLYSVRCGQNIFPWTPIDLKKRGHGRSKSLITTRELITDISGAAIACQPESVAIGVLGALLTRFRFNTTI